MGRLSYYLQLAPYPISQLQAWDRALNSVFRQALHAPPSGSPHGLYVAKRRGGLGLYTIQDLATRTIATELVVRLNSGGIRGQVARGRWAAAMARLPNPCAFPPPRTSPAAHYTLYAFALLRRQHLIPFGPTSLPLLVDTYSRHSLLTQSPTFLQPSMVMT